MKLEAIGKILYGGWGDRVIVGIFMGYLRKSTPKSCYEWIKDNHSLLGGVSEREWSRLKKMAGSVNVDITREDIVTGLRERRPDLLGVIINTNGGMDWLDSQIIEVKKKLGLAPTD